MCEKSSSCLRVSGAEGEASSGGVNAELIEEGFEVTSLDSSEGTNFVCSSFSESEIVFSPLCLLQHLQQTQRRITRMIKRRRVMTATMM